MSSASREQQRRRNRENKTGVSVRERLFRLCCEDEFADDLEGVDNIGKNIADTPTDQTHHCDYDNRHQHENQGVFD
jgi:hypothetical protein